MELTFVQLKCVDGKHGSGELAVCASPGSHGRGRVFGGASQGEMRMKCFHVRSDIDRKECVVDLLSELIESWMACPDADPQDPRWPFRGKKADSLDGKWERRDPDFTKSLKQDVQSLPLDIPEEPNRDVDLIRRSPSHAMKRLL